MKITIVNDGDAIIYEDVSYVEIEAPEPVTFDCTNKNSVQIYKVEE